jgi:TolB-like protein
VKTRMRRTWTTRTVLVGVLSMLAVGLLYPLGAVRAYAQLVQLPRVAVLDFENKSGFGGASIARAATDAVAGEYQKLRKFEVLARGEIEQQLRDLDLATPLDKTGFLRLGRALQTESLITGEVNAVTFVGNPKQAQVVLTVRVVDMRRANR